MSIFTGDGDVQKRYISMYFLSIALLVASLPLSKFTMSLFQITTLALWLWHGVDVGLLSEYKPGKSTHPLVFITFVLHAITEIGRALKTKLILFARNKPAMVLASLMLLHVIGLLYTTDFDYALKDLRTKLPVFTLPLFLATGPKMSSRTFYRILALFVAAVLAGSLYRLALFVQTPIADSRDLETHTSHIRYSLNAVFALFVLFFFIFKKDSLATGLRLASLFIAIWLIGFMIYMNYTTGILIFGLIGILLLVVNAIKIKKPVVKIIALSAIAMAVILPLSYVISIAENYLHTPAVAFSKLDKYTPYGNSYYHDTVNFKPKNGQWTGLYICDKELRQAWAQRSKIPIDGLDKNKQIIRSTLITYLASKGLRKDENGIKQLTDADIRHIEDGINRFDYGKLPGLREQVEDFMAGYQHYVKQHDPNSGSMVQRFEYWRTSLLIIGGHPLIGVGTGDVPDAFDLQYQKMHSNLAPQYRLRSHNQYLSITIAFGILGLLWFIAVMIYPGAKTGSFKNYFYIIFWIIMMLSMLTEDTIESQEGVTFFALLTALMLFGRKNIPQGESLLN